MVIETDHGQLPEASFLITIRGGQTKTLLHKLPSVSQPPDKPLQMVARDAAVPTQIWVHHGGTLYSLQGGDGGAKAFMML